MNLHKHESDLAKLLHDGYRLSGGKAGKKPRREKTYSTGMYIMSQNASTKFHKMGVSYGNTGGLYKRLKDYKICFNRTGEEWYLRYLVISPEIIKKGTKKKLSLILEERLKAAVEKTGLLDKGSYSKEWLMATDLKYVEQLLLTELDKDRSLWDIALKFSTHGWSVLYNHDTTAKFTRKPTSDTSVVNGIVGSDTTKDVIDGDSDMFSDVNLLYDVRRGSPATVKPTRTRKKTRKFAGFSDYAHLLGKRFKR